MSRNHRRMIISALLVCLSSFPVAAATISLGSNLSGDQEVPPVVTDALGLGSMTYDTDADTFDITVLVSGIDAADLADNPGRFHIHGPADPGENAGVLVNLGTMDSFIEFPDGVLAFTSSGVSFPGDQEADLLAGRTYLNLHTTDQPSGEIRGQLVVPEPQTLTLLLAMLGLVAAHCRRRRS